MDQPFKKSGAVIFCYLNHALADVFPLGSAAPCVARTFLPRFPVARQTAAAKPSAFLNRKGIKFGGNYFFVTL